MTPQQKFEFLNIVKKYLDNNYQKNEYQAPKLKKKKSNIQELFTMYNFYINNTHENTNSTNFSRANIMYRNSNMLNTSLKSNLRRNNIINNNLNLNLRKNSSITPKEIYNSIKKESRKNIHSENLKNNINNFYGGGEKNKIKMKKIKFSNYIMNYAKKNLDIGNNLEKNKNFNKVGNNENNNINLEENIILSRNKKRMTDNNSLNNKLFKNEKITTKNIFEVLLKNKCEIVKNQIFDGIGGEKTKDNLGFKININNNIDVRNEDYIKNLFFGNKFS